MDARSIAANVLASVIQEQRSLDHLLPEKIELIKDKRDQAFAQELCYGVLRWYPRLSFILDKMLEKRLRKKDADIQAVLLSGIYQLEYLRTPAHAAVSASVETAKKLKKNWACSLINAVLRRYQRQTEQLQQSISSSVSAQYAHPLWLIEQLQTDWPEHWQGILQKNNDYPPLHLRVNQLRTTRKDYLQMLRTADIKATESELVDSGIHVIDPVNAEQLPGFQDGLVSVQDFAAQFAAPLLDLATGQRILDACAAPGGKTAHIYETQPELGALLALESSKRRVETLKSTIGRLQVACEIVHADAADTKQWWDGRPFDRVLLDVPCSATGVIRRHPDIKLLRKPEQIAQFAETQARLLNAIWPLLKTQGLMLYATCSVLARENDIQIENFLSLHKDVQIIEINADWGVKTRYGRQALPVCDDTDSFYYAVLRKMPVNG